MMMMMITCPSWWGQGGGISQLFYVSLARVGAYHC